MLTGTGSAEPAGTRICYICNRGWEDVIVEAVKIGWIFVRYLGEYQIYKWMKGDSP